MATRMTPKEIEVALQTAPKWTLTDGREAITRTFDFADFNQAWGFMSQVALKAETLNHHPEWFNVFHRVEVTLATHDCGGLSELDFRLATFMNSIAE